MACLHVYLLFPAPEMGQNSLIWTEFRGHFCLLSWATPRAWVWLLRYEITLRSWHMVIQAVESLPWVGLTIPLSLLAWDKGVPHSQNPCIGLISATCTPIPLPPQIVLSPVGVNHSPSKLLKAWSLSYSSGGVEKCCWTPDYDPPLPVPPIAILDKVLHWDLLLKSCQQFIGERGSWPVE